MSRTAFAVAFTAAIVVLLAQLSIHFNSPWRYIHDDNGMHYSIFGYSHVVEGPVATGFHNAYRDKDTHQITGRYLNHPPLLGLAVGAAFWATGRSDYAVARGTAVLFHLITVFSTCWLAWRLFDRSRPAALLAAVLFALMPISTYFGKTPTYQPIAGALSMAGVVTCYLAVDAWRNRRSGLPWLAAGVPVWFLAMNADWDAHVFLAALGAWALYGWFRPDGIPRRAYGGLMLYVTVLSIFGLAFTIGHILWVGGYVKFQSVIDGFTAKTGERSLHEQGWTYLITGPLAAVDQVRRYFAFGPVVLAGIWLWRCVGRWRRAPLESRDRWLFALFGVGAFFIVVASEGVNQHAYFTYPFQPFVVLASAALLLGFLPRLGPLWRQRRLLPLAAAAVLAAITLAHSFDVLRYRYASPSGYVIRRVAGWRERVLVPPGQRELPESVRATPATSSPGPAAP